VILEYKYMYYIQVLVNVGSCFSFEKCSLVSNIMAVKVDKLKQFAILGHDENHTSDNESEQELNEVFS